MELQGSPETGIISISIYSQYHKDSRYPEFNGRSISLDSLRTDLYLSMPSLREGTRWVQAEVSRFRKETCPPIRGEHELSTNHSSPCRPCPRRARGWAPPAPATWRGCPWQGSGPDGPCSGPTPAHYSSSILTNPYCRYLDIYSPSASCRGCRRRACRRGWRGAAPSPCGRSRCAGGWGGPCCRYSCRYCRYIQISTWSVCRRVSSCPPGPRWPPSPPPRRGTAHSRCGPPHSPPGRLLRRVYIVDIMRR